MLWVWHRPKTPPEQLRPEPFAIEVGYVRFSLCITQGALSLDVASSADGAHASMLTRLDAAAARLLAYQLMAAADHLEGLL